MPQPNGEARHAPGIRGSKTCHSRASAGKWCACTTSLTTNSSIDGWRETWSKDLSPGYSFLSTWLCSFLALISFHVGLLAFSCSGLVCDILWVHDRFLLSCAWLGYVRNYVPTLILKGIRGLFAGFLQYVLGGSLLLLPSQLGFWVIHWNYFLMFVTCLLL